MGREARLRPETEPVVEMYVRVVLGTDWCVVRMDGHVGPNLLPRMEREKEKEKKNNKKNEAKKDQKKREAVFAYILLLSLVTNLHG